jgi:hypothetical protein
MSTNCEVVPLVLEGTAAPVPRKTTSKFTVSDACVAQLARDQQLGLFPHVSYIP